MTRGCGDGDKTGTGMFVRHSKDTCLQLSIPGSGQTTGGPNLRAQLQKA